MLANMIEQHYNHPSVILWGLGNENDWPGDQPDFDKEKIRAFMKELNDLAHYLDPSRKTCIRRCDFCKDIVDVYSPSIWAGWYRGIYTEYKQVTEDEFKKVDHFLHMEWGGDSHAGRHSENPDKALQNVKASGAQVQTVREQYASLVVSQYLGSQRAAADVRAAQSRVELAQALYDLAADLQKNGVGTGIDTLRSNVQLQNEKQRLIVSRTQLETSLYGLARLLSIDPMRRIELADQVSFFDTPAVSAGQTLDRALAARPELRQLLSLQQRAQLEERTAADARLPRLSITALWIEQGLTPNSVIPVYQYQGNIDFPIFTGGRVQAERAKSAIAIRQLQQQEKDFRDRIALEVKTSIAQLDSARSEVEVANLGIQLARQEVEQARDRFQAGVANNVEVITAQDELARAGDNQIAALYRYNQARAGLAHATGQMESLYAK